MGAPASLLERVRTDLDPPASRVFAKLLGVHLAVSLITLSICPQFGFRVWGEGMGLMHLFMGLGEVGCVAACGMFFTVSSIVAAALALSRDELRKLRRHGWLQAGALVFLSLGFFTMVAAELVLTLTAAWALGAWFGSMVAMELGFRLRMGSTAAR
ncbi:MAG: hypothetical protein IT285_09370 [Bdellovibrionales bacterium]|nr:hypothetical protein [Bdellovibrionales bacterium]